MTKIQRMENRIKTDDQILQKINTVINELENGQRESYPQAIGAITAILELNNRRPVPMEAADE